MKQPRSSRGAKTAASVAAAADAVAGRGSDAEAPGTPPPAGPALKKAKPSAAVAAAKPEADLVAKKEKSSQAEQSAAAAARKDAKALAASDGFEVRAATSWGDHDAIWGSLRCIASSEASFSSCCFHSYFLKVVMPL